MSSAGRAAAERAADHQRLLDELLMERGGLLTVADRVLALRGTARLIGTVTGAPVGFVSAIEGDRGVIRWLAGARGDALKDLNVPVGQGLGGRVMALQTPVRVPDYVSSPAITHQFDGVVHAESLSAMMAVPILGERAGRTVTVAVAYAALRGPGEFGDEAVTAMTQVAADTARVLTVADQVAAERLAAIATERHRMQADLHDSVGAMLFSIGAQVRDLRSALPDNPVLRSRLGRLEADVSAASAALREALLALSETAPERALPIELTEHCRSFEARTGVPARLVQLGEVRPLDAERTGLLVAAVREGLLNVEKHAHASTVVVSIGEVEGGVHVAVADDGPPREQDGAARAGSGLGLRMLVERAARLGGRLSVVHDEDGGTTLRVTIPLPGGAPNVRANHATQRPAPGRSSAGEGER